MEILIRIMGKNNADIKKQNLSGKTIILVTHNLEDAVIANRIITMKDGKIFKDENNRQF